MNGIEFLERLYSLESWEHLPVIVLSFFYDDALVIEQATQRALMRVWLKPMGMENF